MSKSKLKIIEVNIWSDIACPWCYVGETIFKKSIIQFNQIYPEIKVIPIFHAYIIDPGTKTEGEDYLSYNKRRWGSDNWTKHLRAMGQKYGADFKNWKFWPNTLLAHQLILKGKLNNKSEEILKECFLLTYEKGENVSLESVINKLGNKFNISDWNNKNVEKEVLEEDMIAKDNYGIGGVPLFKFEDGSVLEGAQDPKVFEHVLNKNLKK